MGTTELLAKIGTKAGDIPKPMEDHRQVLDVLLDWSHENGRIIRVDLDIYIHGYKLQSYYLGGILQLSPVELQEQIPSDRV
jgi:hypothetical protein